MANTKKVKGILLISRDKLDCFVATISNTLSLSFPLTVVKNMDVLDKNALLAHIQAFTQTNKLPPTAFSLVIHENILFEKLFPHEVRQENQKPPVSNQPAQAQSGSASTASSQPTQSVSPPKNETPHPVALQVAQGSQGKLSEEQIREEEEKKIEQFVDSVPFEETIVKTVKSPQGTLVIVANKDLMVGLKDAFEKAGHTIDSVIPATILGKEINLTSGLTIDTARILTPKLDAVRSQNMLIEEPKLNAPPVGPVAMGLPQKASEKKRLIAMAGVFGILIIILIVLFVRMNAENAATRERAAAQLPTVAPTVAPSSSPSAAASTSAAYKQVLPIQITINPTTATLAAQLQQQLRQIGYQNIILDQRGAVTAQSLVIFTGEIPGDVKEEVAGIVTTLDSTTAVQQNASGELRVIITL